MPKDEFDFEDPFELNGMAFLSHEDTTNDMAETFTEEFMRMGYSHKQIVPWMRAVSSPGYSRISSRNSSPQVSPVG
jgi:hypothetical protein